MEKRRFLKGAATLAALAPIGAATASPDGRRFGTPASVIAIDPALQNKMRLTFARSDIPVEIWDRMTGLAVGLGNLRHSADARRRFGDSPRRYFEAMGVETDADFSRSPEVAMARLVMDEDAQQAAQHGDYVTFMERVKSHQLPVMPDASLMTREMVRLMQRDANLLALVTRAVGTGVSEAEALSMALHDAGTRAVEPDDGSVTVFVACQAGIDGCVVAAVAVSITAFGGCFGIECSDPRDRRFGQISRLDPRVLEAASTATTAARRLGNTTFEVRVAKDMLAREVEAIFGAAETVGLLTVDAPRRDAMLARTIAKMERVCGLS